MKKLLYILNDCMRRFSYERIAGLYRAIQRMDEPASLYIMRTDGHAAFAPEHNRGEYSIFQLPCYGAFDGIFLDINSIFSSKADSFEAGALYAVKAAAASGKPVISIANDLEEFYYAGIDNYSAMRSVIAHLHGALGLRDFWFAMGPADNFEVQQRAQALRDHCRENGLPCGEDRFYFESFTVQCGEQAFRRLRARHNALPQAIICANDRIALGVCHAAETAGLAIPGDFMVTGFDNDEISPYLTPSLTSLDQLSWTMGDTCIDAMRRIWRGEALPRHIFTPTELVLRESTGHVAVNLADQRRLIAEYMNQNSIVSDFSYKLSALQYQLPGCRTIQEICLALMRCLSVLHLRGLQLVLDEQLFDPNDAALPSMGYSDTMQVVFSWEAGREPRFDERRAGDISRLWNAAAGQNYLFSPLHFMEHTVGYLCIWDCVELVRIHAVSTVVNTLTVALQNFFSKRNLAHMNQVLSSLSMRDDLTGLYNRLGLHKLAYPLCRQGRTGVLFLDMDRLKYINDTYGHEQGDRAIRCVAAAIRRCAPEDAIPVRFGGDEFLIILPADSAETLQSLARSIEAALPDEAAALDLPIALGFSAGFVVAEPGQPLEDCIRAADNLMYREKKRRHMERDGRPL